MRWPGHSTGSEPLPNLSGDTAYHRFISTPDALALVRIGLVIPIMAFTRADQIESHYGIAAILFAVAAFTGLS